METSWYSDYTPAGTLGPAQARYVAGMQPQMDVHGANAFDSSGYAEVGVVSTHTPAPFRTGQPDVYDAIESAAYTSLGEAWGTSAPAWGTGAPSGSGAPGLDYELGTVSEIYDARRVSCANCKWVLEDKDWCCKNNCNDADGESYRRAYVCADPSDASGRLTSACAVDTACRQDSMPLLCTQDRLQELQQMDTRADAACSGPWGTPEPSEWGTPAPSAWGTPAPTAWGTPAPSAWGTSAPTAWGTPAPSAWGTPAATAWGTPAPSAWGTPAPLTTPWSTSAATPWGSARPVAT